MNDPLFAADEVDDQQQVVVGVDNQAWLPADQDDRLSFEDSERFEEDSMCSWDSDPESANNNWSGWNVQPNIASLSYNGGIGGASARSSAGGSQPWGNSGGSRTVASLIEMCAKHVANHIPFDMVQQHIQPLPDHIQKTIAFYSFPDNQHDIRLYSCLANGNADEFNKGESLYYAKAVYELLQMGFHLSATVRVPLTSSGTVVRAALPCSSRCNLQHQQQNGRKNSKTQPSTCPAVSTSYVEYFVEVTLDRKKITHCECTCSAQVIWCSHVVAACLHRIHMANIGYPVHSAPMLREQISDAVTRLDPIQKDKFILSLISEQLDRRRPILPHAQELLDDLFMKKLSRHLNDMHGAPDPTCGGWIDESASWFMNQNSLRENLRKILTKFCVPSPTVLSDVNYLSSSAPWATTEWQCILQALVGRLPEGIWNLLAIVQEMAKRKDSNATQLLHIITLQCLGSLQVVGSWYVIMYSQSPEGSKVISPTQKASANNTLTVQYSCALLMEEIVRLWRLIALNPVLSSLERAKLADQLKDYHLRAVQSVSNMMVKANNNDLVVLKIIGKNINLDSCRYDFESFTGFKFAVQACFLTWVDFGIYLPGVRTTGTKQCASSSKGSLHVCVHEGHRGDSAGRSMTPLSGSAATICGQFSPASQGSASPTLPVLRSKQFKNFSTHIRQHAPQASSQLDDSATDMNDDLCVRNENGPIVLGHPHASNDDSANSSSDESGQDSGSGSIFMPLEAQMSVDTDEGLVVRAQDTPTLDEVADAKLAAQFDQMFRTEPEDEASTSKPRLVTPPPKPEAAALAPSVVTLSPTEIVTSNFNQLDKELDQFEVKFWRVEALYTHGFTQAAETVGAELAEELHEKLNNGDIDLMIDIPLPVYPSSVPILTPTKSGRKKKRSVEALPQLDPIAFLVGNLAEATYYKGLFLVKVLCESQKYAFLAFKLGVFMLELARQPVATKFLEVKLKQQEAQLVRILEKMVIGQNEAELLRTAALRFIRNEYTNIDQPRPVLPLALAGLVCEALYWDSSKTMIGFKQGDNERVFRAATNALGLRTCVGEAEHPLLCEGIRRQRGELALNLFLRYKDQQDKLSVILDKFLDPAMHLLYRSHAINVAPCFYQPAVVAIPEDAEGIGCHSGTQRQPAAVLHSQTLQRKLAMVQEQSQRSMAMIDEVLEPIEQVDDSASLADDSRDEPAVPDEDFLMNSVSFSLSRKTSMDENATVQSSSSSGVSLGVTPTNFQPPQPLGLSGGKFPLTPYASGTSAQDQISSVLSAHQGQSSLSVQQLRTNHISSANAVMYGHVGTSGASTSVAVACSEGAAALKHNVFAFQNLARPQRLRQVVPSQPNQPSEAQAHFMFEMAKTLLTKAGGTQSTAIFSAGQHANQPGAPTGPHRALHLCAFQIGMYALGLHNRVSPNWASRTYSSHVSWLTGQALEIGFKALKILIQAWENHLTPPEVATIADKASQGRTDQQMVLTAAELALSVLPHAQALNPNEIHRALSQCRDQNMPMIEHACDAIEKAAKNGDVYPEVLFMVARQWYQLHIESHSNQSPPAPNGGILPVAAVLQPPQYHQMAPMPPNHHQPQQPGALAILPHQQVAAARLPQFAVSQAAVAAAAASHYIQAQNGLPLLQNGGAALLPNGFFLPTSMFGATSGIFPPHHAQNMVRPAYGPYGNMPGYMQQIPHGFVPQVTAAHNLVHQHSHPPQPFNPNGGVFPGPNGGAFVGHRMHISHSAPNLAPLNHPNHQGGAAQHQQHQVEEMVAQQQQPCHLARAYKVGMSAMDTMGRRMHDDNRNYVKYAQNPPYGDDVKWLFTVAKQLGPGYVQQFVLIASNSVVSPFILYDLFCQAVPYLPRGSEPYAKLWQKCLQMFKQAADQKLSHPRFTPNDFEELSTLVLAARQAYITFYSNHPHPQAADMHFKEFMSGLKKTRACKKDLWQKLLAALNANPMPAPAQS